MKKSDATNSGKRSNFWPWFVVIVVIAIFVVGTVTLRWVSLAPDGIAVTMRHPVCVLISQDKFSYSVYKTEVGARNNYYYTEFVMKDSTEIWLEGSVRFVPGFYLFDSDSDKPAIYIGEVEKCPKAARISQ